MAEVDPERPRVRVVFMGTPDFAVPSLRALAADPRVDVCLVVSQPDRRSGRGNKVKPTPVKAAAVELGLEVAQPETLRSDDAFELLAAQQADLFVVAAYGQILRQRVLDLPRFGCVNVHASLLPRWRGAAPIHRAIEAADATTGVAIMRMERGLDTGPVYRMSATMIGDTETAGELHDRLAADGAALLGEALADVLNPEFEPTPQPTTRTTYARMLTNADRPVDFDAPATDVAARINGMSPWPGITVYCDSECMTLVRARVSALGVGDADAEERANPGAIVAASPRDGLHVACREGVVEILEIKRPGKRAMLAADCLRGVDIPVGATLGSNPKPIT